MEGLKDVLKELTLLVAETLNCRKPPVVLWWFYSNFQTVNLDKPRTNYTLNAHKIKEVLWVKCTNQIFNRKFVTWRHVIFLKHESNCKGFLHESPISHKLTFRSSMLFSSLEKVYIKIVWIPITLQIVLWDLWKLIAQP